MALVDRGGDETFSDKSTRLEVCKSDGPDAQLLGVTLGFEINDHMRLFVTHMQTLSEEKNNLSLEASLTKVTLSGPGMTCWRRCGSSAIDKTTGAGPRPVTGPAAWPPRAFRLSEAEWSALRAIRIEARVFF